MVMLEYTTYNCIRIALGLVSKRMSKAVFFSLLILCVLIFIRRHTKKGALKVIVYEGFQRGTGDLVDDQVIGANYGKVVGAHELAMADIVLTTYSTLQADLSHVTDGDDSQHRAMRYIKRYLS